MKHLTIDYILPIDRKYLLHQCESLLHVILGLKNQMMFAKYFRRLFGLKMLV